MPLPTRIALSYPTELARRRDHSAVQLRYGLSRVLAGYSGGAMRGGREAHAAVPYKRPAALRFLEVRLCPIPDSWLVDGSADLWVQRPTGAACPATQGADSGSVAGRQVSTVASRALGVLTKDRAPAGRPGELIAAGMSCRPVMA